MALPLVGFIVSIGAHAIRMAALARMGIALTFTGAGTAGIMAGRLASVVNYAFKSLWNVRIPMNLSRVVGGERVFVWVPVGKIIISTGVAMKVGEYLKDRWVIRHHTGQPFVGSNVPWQGSVSEGLAAMATLKLQDSDFLAMSDKDLDETLASYEIFRNDLTRSNDTGVFLTELGYNNGIV